jgi:hypothetical protein
MWIDYLRCSGIWCGPVRGKWTRTQRSQSSELVTYSVNMTHVAKIELWVYAAHPFKLGMCFGRNLGLTGAGIATGYGLDDRGVGVRVPVGSRILFTSSTPDLGFTQPIQWVPGALSPGVKRPGREADHSPPASVEVKKMWIYTSTSPHAFLA